MNETTIRSRGKTRTTLSRAFAFALSALMLLAFTAGASFAAAPNAGQTIGNQATANYQLGGVAQPQVTSNSVTTVVQQIAALTLTASQTKSVAVGGTVYFQHTVTNTGNGDDKFNLTAVAGGGALGLTTGIYADTGSGPGAVLNPAQTITLIRNASFTFYVAATATTSVPATANTVLVTATSQFNAAVNAPNTDTVNLSPYAVLNFLKFATANTGKSSDTVTYTIRYTNNGNQAATNVVIADPIPTGMTYVANSGRWTLTGATVLTDATGAAQGPGPTIDYSFDGPTTKVNAIISSVPMGATADLTFQVTVNANLGPQTITNIATYNYNNGNAQTSDATVTADFTISTVRSVVIDDIGSTTDTPASPPAVSDKTVIVSSVAQGGVVWFDNVIHNTGNVADTYQMSLNSNAFPAGSNVQYYNAQNGGLLGGDVTGNVLANTGTYHVWVKVTLPMNAKAGGPYTLVLKATSSGNGAVSDTVTDTLTTITPAAVDMTNNAAIGGGGVTGVGIWDGTGADPGAQTTLTGSNTAPAVFSLYLNNTGQTPETFNLAFSSTPGFSPAITLPAGWTVAFTAPVGGVCSNASIGTPLAGNNSAIINGGANIQVCAVVTPPAGVPGNQTVAVYFKATGNSTGASDIKHDAVTTAATLSLTLLPNNTGQIVPNGTKVYTHNLCNLSNVAVATSSNSLTFTMTGNVWSTTLYANAGLTTVLTDVHQLNGTTGLGAAGSGTACAPVYVKVNAPAGPLGAVDTATINVILPALTVVATATDTTTLSMALTIDKSQALDALCTTAYASLTYGTGNITGGATPGACIAYKLVVNNLGNSQATTVTISDALTPYTVYSQGIDCFTGTPPVIKSPLPGGLLGASGTIGVTALTGPQISPPAECATGGTVTFGPSGNELTIDAGAVATLYFRVQIQK